MWSQVSRTSGAGPELASSVKELLQATTRNLVWITGTTYLLLHLMIVASGHAEYQDRLAPIAGIILLTCGLVLWLRSHSLLLAQVLWQLGLLWAITAALLIFRRPEIAYLYALLPFAAVVTIGWPAGVVATAAVGGLLLWLVHRQILPPSLVWYPGAIAIGAGFTGALGWAASSSLLTVAEWAIYSYEQAQAGLEEARQRSVQLQETQADLLQANRELARLSDRLKLANQVAEEARRVKEEFVSNVSHELRTPLNMIIGFCEMITQSPRIYGGKLPPMLLSDIAAIQRNSQHLAELVNDVLDLSQVDAGRMALSKGWCALQDIITAAMQSVQALYLSKGLALEADLPEDRLLAVLRQHPHARGGA